MARNVVIVGYGLSNTLGDAVSSRLFRSGQKEAGLKHLTQRMKTTPESLIGHYGIRKGELAVLGWDPDAFSYVLDETLAEPVTYRVLRKKGGAVEDRVLPAGALIGTKMTEQLPVTTMGQRPTGWNFNQIAGFSGSRFKNMGDASRAAVFCSLESIKGLGMSWSNVRSAIGPKRIGCYITSSLGSGDRVQSLHINPHRGVRNNGTILPEALSGSPGGHVTMAFGLEGNNESVNGECAAAGLSLYNGFHNIRNGTQDAAFVGGVSYALMPSAIKGFDEMGALATDEFLRSKNLKPEQASRAFDVTYGGFVLSEGAAVLLAMEEELAVRLGFTILVRVLGVGNKADGFQVGLASPGPGLGHALDESHETASQDPSHHINHIDFYEAHGTSTGVNETNEAKEGEAFLERNGRDPQNPVPVVARKQSVGHTAEASAVDAMVETIEIILSGEIPANPNLVQLDPALPPHPRLLITGDSREIGIPTDRHGRPRNRVGMGGTAGFGHHNATWMFEGAEGDGVQSRVSAAAWKEGERAVANNAEQRAEVAAKLVSGDLKLYDLLPDEVKMK